MSIEPPAPPDPVRLAFARIESWKAVCLALALLALALPWVVHPRLGSLDWNSTDPGWSLLGQCPPFGAVLPWIVVKAFAVHSLLAVWFRCRPASRLSAGWTLSCWAASTAADAFLLWAAGKGLRMFLSCCGSPLRRRYVFEPYNFEAHLTPGTMLFIEGLLGVAILAFVFGQYILYRGMRARARADVIGPEVSEARPRECVRAVRIVLLVISLAAFLGFPWSSVPHLAPWGGGLAARGRAPGYVYLLEIEGVHQRGSATLVALALLLLLVLACIVRPHVKWQELWTRPALLCAEGAGLLAWGVGYSMLAFHPIEWATSERWFRANEVAPFLGFQLLALCSLETLWLSVRRRSTDATDGHG